VGRETNLLMEMQRQDAGGLALGYCDGRMLLVRNRENFLLVRKDRFLIGENGFLIRENFIQNGLVLQDRRLIVKQCFLIFQNGSLVAEDCFLVRYYFML
jgi:hypothetical protein